MAEIPEDQLHPTNVDSGQLVITDPIFGRLKNLFITGKYLWVSDRTGDPFIHVVDMTEGVVVQSRVREGEGPGELHSTSDITARQADSNAVWVFDVNLQRLIRVSGDPRSPNHTVRAPPSLPTLQMFWLGGDTIAALSPFDSARVSLLDSLGHRFARRPSPQFLGDSVPLRQRIELATNVVTCVRPDHQMFAVAYVVMGRIELYDRTGRFLRAAAVPFPDGGLEAAGGAGLHLPPIQRLRLYYIGCSATNHKLYALFSGRHWGGLNSPYMNHGAYVHVFDWTGVLVDVLRLPQAVGAIFALGDTAIMAIPLGDTAIYRYHIGGH